MLRGCFKVGRARGNNNVCVINHYSENANQSLLRFTHNNRYIVRTGKTHRYQILGRLYLRDCLSTHKLHKTALRDNDNT